VFAAPAVTGLAPDANFQKLLGPEALAHGRDPLAQRRGQVAGQAAGLAEKMNLVRKRRARSIGIGDL